MQRRASWRLPLTLALLWAAAHGDALAAAGTSDVCRLLTRGDISAVAGVRLAETKATSRVAAGMRISDCFYRAEAFEKSVSLEVIRRAGSEGPALRERWEKMFHAEGDPEGELAEAGEGNKAPPSPLPGIGEEAFWIRNPASGVLYVLKGDAYVRISVGGGDPEPVKRRKAADLARRVLSRLSSASGVPASRGA
jgi:hypothetical protein